jgi:hypothetical protein
MRQAGDPVISTIDALTASSNNKLTFNDQETSA